MNNQNYYYNNKLKRNKISLGICLDVETRDGTEKAQDVFQALVTFLVYLWVASVQVSAGERESGPCCCRRLAGSLAVPLPRQTRLLCVVS